MRGSTRRVRLRRRGLMWQRVSVACPMPLVRGCRRLGVMCGLVQSEAEVVLENTGRVMAKASRLRHVWSCVRRVKHGVRTIQHVVQPLWKAVRRVYSTACIAVVCSRIGWFRAVHGAAVGSSQRLPARVQGVCVVDPPCHVRPVVAVPALVSSSRVGCGKGRAPCVSDHHPRPPPRSGCRFRHGQR